MMLGARIRCHFLSRLCFLVALVGFFAVGANADMFDQWRLVENNSGLYSTYASQLSLNVTPFGSMVDFTFTNSGPNPSSITGIYFEDGTLLGLASVIALDPLANDPSRDGLVFGQPAHPSNMPGWATLSTKFYATSAFTVGSNGAPDGVSPGESLVLRYTLQPGKTYADVISALYLGFTNPDPTDPRNSLRIGLHIQDLGQESDSLLLTPVPGAWILGMLGLSIAGIKLRKHA